MRALILEDNRDRRVAMIGRLKEWFAFLEIVFFEAADEMIDFLGKSDVADVAVIALDNDLEMIPCPSGEWIDPGDGLDVARWLSQRPMPICPVVVHTTNSRAGDQMMELLDEAHWVSHRVIPHGDLEWIDSDWFRVVRKAIVDFAPRPNETGAQANAKTDADRYPATIQEQLAELVKLVTGFKTQLQELQKRVDELSKRKD